MLIPCRTTRWWFLPLLKCSSVLLPKHRTGKLSKQYRVHAIHNEYTKSVHANHNEYTKSIQVQMNKGCVTHTPQVTRSESSNLAGAGSFHGTAVEPVNCQVPGILSFSKKVKRLSPTTVPICTEHSVGLPTESKVLTQAIAGPLLCLLSGHDCCPEQSLKGSGFVKNSA